jgi:hypothetical protein
MTNPNKDRLLEAKMPENARVLSSFAFGESGVAIHPMYFTDAYPRDGLKLVTSVLANGAFWLSVYHPDKETPLESYPCADVAVLHQRIAEWLAKHPMRVSS